MGSRAREKLQQETLYGSASFRDQLGYLLLRGRRGKPRLEAVEGETTKKNVTLLDVLAGGGDKEDAREMELGKSALRENISPFGGTEKCT